MAVESLALPLLLHLYVVRPILLDGFFAQGADASWGVSFWRLRIFGATSVFPGDLRITSGMLEFTLYSELWNIEPSPWVLRFG